MTDSVAALQEAVRRGGPRLRAVGGGTKPALSALAGDDVAALDVGSLQGILDYDPAELTFTALAGTRVSAVADVLAEHGQYLPFDPPWAASGATLGGSVAAGASGPNAFRHGGVRDFVIGVRLIDGTGRLVAGGGSVVKNAAGFDLPKLMVGSAGRLGVMTELSFKVFPRPAETATLIFELSEIASALAAIAELARGPVALDALDLEPPGRLLARIGGDGALAARAARLTAAVGVLPQRLDGHADRETWAAAAELAWLRPDERVVRVALTVRAAAALHAELAATGARARFSIGAAVAWVAWPAERPLGELDAILRRLGLPGTALTGPPSHGVLGAVRHGGAFGDRVTAALDPRSRFAA